MFSAEAGARRGRGLNPHRSIELVSGSRPGALPRCAGTCLAEFAHGNEAQRGGPAERGGGGEMRRRLMALNNSGQARATCAPPPRVCPSFPRVIPHRGDAGPCPSAPAPLWGGGVVIGEVTRTVWKREGKGADRGSYMNNSLFPDCSRRAVLERVAPIL